MTDTRTRMFVMIVVFWFAIVMISNIFHITILTDDIPNEISGVKLLLSAMSFQHIEELPVLFGAILDLMAIFTIFILYTLFSPLD